MIHTHLELFLNECSEIEKAATKGPWTAINCKIYALEPPPLMQKLAVLENLGASEDTKLIAFSRNNFNTLTESLRLAVKEMKLSVSRADDYGDSFITAPIRDALEKIDSLAKARGGE